MIDQLHRFVIPAAYSVLPSAMESDAATALLLAIALQESKATHRRQKQGPARSFWQFETIGVAEVMRHPRTSAPMTGAIASLRYPKTSPARTLQTIMEHNDILAAVIARLNLWRLPKPLPGPLHDAEGWQQYLECWRPGAPHPDTWRVNYAIAWQMVTAKGEQ